MTKLKHLARKCTKAVASLFDGTSTATFSLAAWPNGITGRLKFTISPVAGHTDCAGTITAGTETITFTQAGTKTSTVNLTAKPVTTSANLDCHVHITVVDTGGADVIVSTETDLPCRIWQKKKSVQQPNGVWTTIQETYLWVRDLTIVPTDRIKFDLANRKSPTNGIEYTVAAIDPIEGPGGVEHMRILRF